LAERRLTTPAGLGRLHRRLALLDCRDRHHAAAKFMGALEIVVRKLNLRLQLRDQAARLVDRRIGAFGRRIVLGEERIYLSAIKPREHLSLRHAIAILGVEFDDRKPVDASRYLRFFARDQRS
jgi:hypothetical protein